MRFRKCNVGNGKKLYWAGQSTCCNIFVFRKLDNMVLQPHVKVHAVYGCGYWRFEI